MNKERATTYSFLAHIRNTGTLAKGPIDIFIPLVKRALSYMNSKGIHKGKSILEIKAVTDELYGLDFPVPALKKVLDAICIEVNDKEITRFILHKDLSFSINEYTFDEFDDVLKEQERDIEEVEQLFKQFCKNSDLDIKNSESIFKFIEKNKFNLSKYISHNQNVNGEDYTAEAQFIDFFKRIPTVYEKIKNIYLGSIISGYIEYAPDEIKREVKLLLDTNFIVGLLDLNTPESTHTCRTLLKIAKQQGYKVTVLIDTINETTNLLEKKAEYFDKSFLQKKVNTEDVYNACERRNLSKIDLERIADNIGDSLREFGISTIPYTEKLKNEAKFTDEYKILLEYRSAKIAALHDAMAILFIRKERKNKRIQDFDKVNAWFVNNTATLEGENFHLREGFQPEIIKADDLLNILWLSNPQITNSIEGGDLAEIGLTSTIALTLSQNLPKAKILRELDDNIHKYAEEKISDEDIIRVATRITNKQLKDIESLNLLAEQNKEEFIKRLEDEAKKQKEIEDTRIKNLEKVFNSLSIRTDNLEKSKKKYEEKSKSIDAIIAEKSSETDKLKSELLKEKNEARRVKRDAWIDNELVKWRRKSWVLFFISLAIFIGIALYLLYQSQWNINLAIQRFQNWQADFIIGNILSILSFLFIAIVLYLIKDKYWNHSNIKSFKSELKIPDELKELEKPSR
ncbi:hypothetical protein [Thalassobellus suaedae]|uniref:Uncharacterized protein n=1 Tax=Thalassobellus suaedae TaxID=3074124 RepID=A0ABY9Y202_9FLAO|nr:hypothetical protein RHP49_13860 [Flavobacteriaceae bacterium HL-DH10]